MYNIYYNLKHLFEFYKKNRMNEMLEKQNQRFIPIVGCVFDTYYLNKMVFNKKPFIFCKEYVKDFVSKEELKALFAHEECHIKNMTLDEKVCDEYAEKQFGCEFYRNALIKIIKASIICEIGIKEEDYYFNDMFKSCCFMNSSGSYSHRTWLREYASNL